MGLLVDGKWQDKWYDTKASGGAFKREDSQIRNWITSDGAAGPDGAPGVKAESGRFHLYVSLACPWAHRTLILRKLKNLEAHIGVSVVSPIMLDQGWTFEQQEGSSGDSLYQSEFLHQIYTRHQADYSGRVTVPVLWDKQQERIVSNESAEIIRMFNSAFDAITGNDQDFCPSTLINEIDVINRFVYDGVNNGVYKCGFATEQKVYETEYQQLFAALDRLETLLNQQRYLTGSELTEADWRLFTTLIRFDAVYYGHFKCNRQRIVDYPNLSAYTRELFQVKGVSETVDFHHIKRHYYYSHPMINPNQIVPLGPETDFNSAHDRDRFANSAAD